MFEDEKIIDLPIEEIEEEISEEIKKQQFTLDSFS